ncbi:MAG: GHKL domain-containing protein [Gammaproteobacteria bacterium]|nr:MAG: GHKL domain-containing protein [Gammaproteobacteria bacterium]
MNAVKEKLLTETYQSFLETGLNSPESLDILNELVDPDIMGYGTTVYEKIFSVADLKELITRQREQSQGIDIHWTQTPVLRRILKDENAAVFVDDIILELTVNNEKIKMSLRYSSIMEYQENKWVVIQFHGSKPEKVTTEEDTWGMEEWKKRNAELEKLVNERTAELENSLTILKSTQSQLIQSEKMASLGELTAGIAHEIQNPLNFVNNFSEVSNELLEELKQEIVNKNFVEVQTIADDVKENLTKILHHGKRADAIVKGMLQHSRSSNNQKELTDINALADEYLRLAYHGLRAKDKSFNATLKTDYDESIENINIVPQDIGRVILNLTTNAFHAVEEKKKQTPDNYEPTVTVVTKRRNDKIEIQVTDNGNGIPQNIIDKIFQPFFTTKPTGQGTGLGLSLAYDIVKAHGGELTVKTREADVLSLGDTTTTFIMSLPTNIS